MTGAGDRLTGKDLEQVQQGGIHHGGQRVGLRHLRTPERQAGTADIAGGVAGEAQAGAGAERRHPAVIEQCLHGQGFRTATCRDGLSP